MKIKELILFTSNLETQIEFYSEVLGLEITFKDATKCSFKTGESILTFKTAENSKPYHFAFNIPSNKEIEAKMWLKERMSLIPFEENEIINIESWNAKALYFYDADDNIVEFIARKNLNVESYFPFTSKSILNISEMALASTKIKETVAIINSYKPIKKYSGDFIRFCAIGNEEGLFIIVNPKLKKWFPTGDEIYMSDFRIKGDYNLEFKNGKFTELM